MSTDSLVAGHFAAIDAAIKLTVRSQHLSPTDAQDLEMELWVCVLHDGGRVLDRFQGRSSLQTYLYTVLKRAAIQWVTKERNQGGAGARRSDSEDVGIPPTAEEDVLRSEARVMLYDAFRRLHPLDEAILRSHLCGDTADAIARDMGLSLKAVHDRIYRSRTSVIGFVRARMGGVEEFQAEPHTPGGVERPGRTRSGAAVGVLRSATAR